MRDGGLQAPHGSPQSGDGRVRGGQHPVRPGDACRWSGDGGLAIHVLGDIAGQEVELLAFYEGLIARKLTEVEARGQAMVQAG